MLELLLREGARRMLADAIEAELDAYVGVRRTRPAAAHREARRRERTV